MLITVLMSVYNPKREYLIKSVKSILNQTYSDFEFLIIDDNSTEEVNNILLEEKINDKRIRIIRNIKNIGLTKSLNLGLLNAKGKYIARMDDDDISYRERLEVELDFLGKHKKYSAVFTGADIIDSKDNKIGINSRNINDKDIIRYLIYKGNFLVHSTAFFNKESILKIGGYDENLLYAQDYELWVRLISGKNKIGYINKTYLAFRKSKVRCTKYKSSMSACNAIFTRFNYLLENEPNLVKKIKFFLSIIKLLNYEFNNFRENK